MVEKEENNGRIFAEKLLLRERIKEVNPIELKVIKLTISTRRTFEKFVVMKSERRRLTNTFRNEARPEEELLRKLGKIRIEGFETRTG